MANIAKTAITNLTLIVKYDDSNNNNNARSTGIHSTNNRPNRIFFYRLALQKDPGWL